MAGISAGVAFVDIVPELKNFGKGISQGMEKQSKTISRAATVTGAAIATGLGVVAKIGFDEFQRGQLITAQTEAVLKSTGNTAGVTAGHIKDLAISLMNKSGVDDQVIRSGENLLLTFQNVRNEVGKGNNIFDRATRSALDMSVALGKDLTGASKTVGKALNAPIKGIGILGRLGVKFTEQQKAQIESMVEHNNVIGAQKIILGQLSQAYGGSADTSDTLATKTAIAKEQFKNLAENLVGALLPAFTAMIDPMEDVAEFLTKHKTTTKVLVGVLVTLAAGLVATGIAIKVYTAATSAATATTWLFNAALAANPILIVVASLAALTIGLVIAYKKSETFRNIVNGAFNAVKAVAGAAINFIKGNWQALLAKLSGPFGVVAQSIVKHWGTIKSTAITAFNAVRGAIDSVMDKLGAAKGKIGDFIDKVKSVTAGPFNTVRDAISSIVGWLGTAISKVYDLISAISRIHMPSLSLPHIPGFKMGGVVPGALGAPRLAVVHGGETVIPAGFTGGGGDTYNIYNHGLIGSQRELDSWLVQSIERSKRRGAV